MSVIIRRAKPEDLKTIQDLNHQLFLSDLQYVDDFNANWPYEEAGETYFKGVIAGELGVCFVAEKDGKIVGYLAGCVRKPHPAFIGKRAEIENMFVKEDLRSKGIGSKLAQAFFDWCKEKQVQNVMVGTLAKNQRAIGFYKKNGFEAYELVLQKHL